MTKLIEGSWNWKERN